MLRLQSLKVSNAGRASPGVSEGKGGGGGGGGGGMHALSFTSTERLTVASCLEEADLSACLESLLRLKKLVLQVAHVVLRLRQLCLQMLLLRTGLLFDQPGA